jgi:PrtD family type I secretion system ABC transporter
MSGQNKSSTVRDALSASRSAFFALCTFSFCINILMLVVPLYMLQVYDRVLTSHSVDTLWALTALAVGLLLVYAMLEMLRSRLLIRIGNRLDRDLNDAVFSSILLQKLRSDRTSQVQGLRDMETLRTYLAGAGLLTFLDAPWTPLFIALIFLFHPWLGTIALIGGILIFALALMGEWLTRRPLREAGRHSMDALSFAECSLRNAEAIGAMGMLPGLKARWLSRHARAVAYQSLASDRNSIVAALAKFMRLFLQIAMLCTGAWLALAQEMTPGAMVAASIVMARALAPIEAAIGSWRSSVSARGAYRRLNELLDQAMPTADQLELPRPAGQLSAENVVVVPPRGGKPIVQNVSFSLSPGEVLAIVGPSGAGKSSLARALVGIWAPFAGQVRLDGVDMAKWRSEERGRYVGYLPQDIELFDGTVAENICRFDVMKSEDIVESARFAGVHDLIVRLPEGYETRLGEGGAMLSGGQRQRIGLARALHGIPALVVLDEPNASLDNEGEVALLEAIAQAKARGTTIIFITHHPRILKAADRLLVLRGGRTEAFGPRTEVMARLTRPAPEPASLAPSAATSA